MVLDYTFSCAKEMGVCFAEATCVFAHKRLGRPENVADVSADTSASYSLPNKAAHLGEQLVFSSPLSVSMSIRLHSRNAGMNGDNITK